MGLDLGVGCPFFHVRDRIVTHNYHMTFDIDWAPDASIELCLDLLDRHDVKATFFATHLTDLNQGAVAAQEAPHPRRVSRRLPQTRARHRPLGRILPPPCLTA